MWQQERYDSGLRFILEAQEARDAGSYTRAHSLFVQGIDQLMTQLQQEQNDETRVMVRKHVKNFMDDAERMVAEQDGSAGPAHASAGGCVGKICNRFPSNAMALQASAQGLEKRARDAERGLKFSVAFGAYAEAAEKYKSLRAQLTDNKPMLSWAGTRALAMVDAAERLKRFVKHSSPGGDGWGAADENTFDLPHVPGSAAAKEQAQTPQNFAKQTGGPVTSVHRPNTLPNSLTETFVRGRSKSDAAEEHVLVVGNKINGRIYERMHGALASTLSRSVPSANESH